jgi:acetyl esterase/lipase
MSFRKCSFFFCSACVFVGFLVGIDAKADESKKPNTTDSTTVLRDVAYGKVGNSVLLMHIVLPSPKPERPVPAIVFIHGGGWASGNRDSGLGWATQCAEAGYVGATIEYRLTQESPFPAQLHDCKCAIRFLRRHAKEYGIAPDRIGGWGSSAGGHLAAMLGLTEGIAEFEGNGGWGDTSSSVQAVCDWYGPADFLSWVRLTQRFGKDTDLRTQFSFPLETPDRIQWACTFANDAGVTRLLGGKALEVPERARWASPTSYVEKSVNTPPFLILHGDQDSWVPYQQSVMLADSLDKNGAKVTFKLLLNSGHGTGHFSSAWPDHVKPFFDKTLRDSGK